MPRCATCRARIQRAKSAATAGDLIASDRYQKRWRDHAQLVRIGETSFENMAKCSREGKPLRSLTGGRGDRLIIDDRPSTETSESEAERQTTIRIFRESVPTHLINPASSAIVVIMQRLHADVAAAAVLQRCRYTHRTPIARERCQAKECQMNDPKVDRKHALTGLAPQLMFDVQKNGARFSLRRDVGLSEPFQSDNLTLDEAEEILNKWKLRGFHGG